MMTIKVIMMMMMMINLAWRCPKTTRTRNNKHTQWSRVIVVSAMRRS